MADFYQSPHIATLHNLRSRAVEELEAQLVNFSTTRPLGLILPSLYSELETPAMPLIRSELEKVPYLSQVVVGSIVPIATSTSRHSRFSRHYRSSTASCGMTDPCLRAIHSELAIRGLAPSEPGKGRNVWYCMGYVLATSRASMR